MANAGNPVSTAVVHQQIAAHANFMANFYAWVFRTVDQWNIQAGSTDALTALGVTDPTQQSQILTVVQSMANLKYFMENTTPLPFPQRRMVDDWAIVLGLQ